MKAFVRTHMYKGMLEKRKNRIGSLNNWYKIFLYLLINSYTLACINTPKMQPRKAKLVVVAFPSSNWKCHHGIMKQKLYHHAIPTNSKQIRASHDNLLKCDDYWWFLKAKALGGDDWTLQHLVYAFKKWKEQMNFEISNS